MANWNWEDEGTVRSLSSLIKNSDGAWKSDRQAQFMYKMRYLADHTFEEASDSLFRFFGVEMKEGQWAITQSGRLLFESSFTGELTSKNSRHVLNVYICDGTGILSKYKVTMKHFKNGAAQPDPTRVSVLWERQNEDYPNLLQEYFDRMAKAQEESAKKKEELVNSGNLPESGRNRVQGKVLTLKVQTGYYGAQYKMLLEEERGFKVWSTVPKGLDPEVGDTIGFVANISTPGDDPTFYVGKNPSKAEKIDTDS